MLKKPIGHFDRKIKSKKNRSLSSPDVWEQLALLRHRNKQLLTEMNETAARLEAAFAEHRALAYAS